MDALNIVECRNRLMNHNLVFENYRPELILNHEQTQYYDSIYNDLSVSLIVESNTKNEHNFWGLFPQIPLPCESCFLVLHETLHFLLFQCFSY